MRDKTKEKTGREDAQSRQSSKLYLQSSELFSQPLTHSRMFPELKGRGGGTHSLASEGVGVTERDSVSTRGYTLWYSISICTMCEEA